jgi:hypothetical protein
MDQDEPKEEIEIMPQESQEGFGDSEKTGFKAFEPFLGLFRKLGICASLFWIAFAMLALLPVIFELSISSEKRVAIQAANSIKYHLEYPKTLEILGIYALFPDFSNSDFVNENGEKSSLNEEIRTMFGDKPKMTFVLYSADSRDVTVGRVWEIFVFLGDDPAGSFREDGESRATTLEFQNRSEERNALALNVAMTVFGYWLDDDANFKGACHVVNSWVVKAHGGLLIYVLALAGLCAIGFAATWIRLKKEERQTEDVEELDADIEDTYPGMPEGLEEFRMENMVCAAWIDEGAVHVLSKDAGELRQMFSRNILIEDICECVMDAEKNCLLFYRDGEDMKFLEFGPDAFEFTSKMRETLASLEAANVKQEEEPDVGQEDDAPKSLDALE